MATLDYRTTCELNRPVTIKHLDGMFFSQDVQANRIVVSVVRGGVNENLSGSVFANIIRADGGTVAQAGEIDGNVVTVTMPAAAYAIPGAIAVFVKHTQDGATSTLAAVTGYVYKSTTDTIVDPGTIIPSIQDLISSIEDATEDLEEAIAAIPQDYQDLEDDVSKLKNEIQQKPEIKDSDKTGVDLDVSDSQGNVILRLEDGHIKTKKFNSKVILNTRETVDTNADLYITDDNGNALIGLRRGHICTKKFDSEQMIETIEEDSGRIDSLEEAIENINVLPIPDYWENTLKEKEAQINAYNQASGADGITFVFITDYHQNTSNHASFPLISHILANTSVCDVVYGGDTTDGGAYNRTRCVEIIKEFGLKWRKFNTIFVRGNHDILPQATDTVKKVTDEEYYDICLRPLERIATIDGKPYFYVDNKSAKTRYIILDTGANINLIDSTQIAFLKGSLTELESGWTAVIFMHWAASTNTEQHTFTLSEHGSRVVEAIHDVYDDLQCEIAAVIAGHSHVDIATTTEDGIPMIWTTCDSGEANSAYDWNNPTRPIGTTGECAFDVFCINRKTKTINTVRIGSGENRSFNY